MLPIWAELNFGCMVRSHTLLRQIGVLFSVEKSQACGSVFPNSCSQAESRVKVPCDRFLFRRGMAGEDLGAARGTAVTVLAVACVLTGNTMTAYGDIFRRLRPFLYFASEIEEDPDHGRNRCIGSYYGVKSVRVEGGGEAAK